MYEIRITKIYKQKEAEVGSDYVTEILKLTVEEINLPKIINSIIGQRKSRKKVEK